MKPQSLQQEILLLTASEVSRHNLAGNIDATHNRHLSYPKQLEEACWNGMLDQLLPGTIETSSSGKKLHLWQIRSGSRFLHIELCTFPTVIERRNSIDPYLFLPLMYGN